MNKLSFYYNEQYYELNFDKILCFNINCKYMNDLADIIVDGLSGGTKEFQFNNTLIKKKEYEVIDYNGTTILDDLKLTSKSYNLKFLKAIIQKYEYKDMLLAQLAECLCDIQLVVQSKYKFLLEDYPGLVSPEFKMDNLENIFQNLFHLVDKEEINDSISREMQLLLILHSLDIKRDSFLVIRDFKQGLDLSQQLYILDKMMRNEKVHVVLFLNDAEFYYYTKNLISHLFVTDYKIDCIFNNEIIENCEKKILYKDFLDRNEYHNIIKVLEKQHTFLKYNELLSERADFINYFFEKYNIDDVI